MFDYKKFAALRSLGNHATRFVEGRFQHSKERMAERYNIELSYAQWEELNFALFVEDEEVCEYVDIGETSNTNIYRMKYRGNQMLVAYSETAYCIMTVMPRNDFRLVHLLQGSYIRKANTEADFIFRNQKLELSDNFDRLIENGRGQFVMPNDDREEADTGPSSTSPFAEALAGFVPKVVEAPLLPVLSLPPKPEPTPEPLVSADPVVASFGKLSTRLDELADGLDEEDAKREEEIEALREQIAKLHAGGASTKLKRQFIDSTRTMAETAFDQYQAGAIDEAGAQGIINMMLIQHAARAPVVPKFDRFAGYPREYVDGVRVTKLPPAAKGSKWSSKSPEELAAIQAKKVATRLANQAARQNGAQ